MDKHFDFGLYALSVFVIILSFFTVFVLTNGLRQINKRTAIIRILFSGVSIGVGIWSTFLISTIALNIPVSYDVSNPISYAPLIFAVLSFFISIRLSYSPSYTRMRIITGSLIMNLGFNCVYALALAAMCLSCNYAIHWGAFVPLLLVGFFCSALTLWFALRQRGVMLTLIGSILIGALATGLNAIGLNSFVVAGNGSIEVGATYSSLLTQFYFALALAAASYVICSLAIVVHYRQEILHIPAPERRDRLASKAA